MFCFFTYIDFLKSRRRKTCTLSLRFLGIQMTARKKHLLQISNFWSRILHQWIWNLFSLQAIIYADAYLNYICNNCQRHIYIMFYTHILHTSDLPWCKYLPQWNKNNSDEHSYFLASAFSLAVFSMHKIYVLLNLLWNSRENVGAIRKW